MLRRAKPPEPPYPAPHELLDAKLDEIILLLQQMYDKVVGTEEAGAPEDPRAAYKNPKA